VKDDQNNILSARLLMTKNQEQCKNAIMASFRSVCRAGPICAEPLRNVRIILLETKLIGQSENAEVANALKKVTYGAILTAGPILLEPIYRIEIVTPTELLGKCARIMALRRGKISQTQQKGTITIISGYVPVAETFNLSTELRSSTSGQAFWQCAFDGWQETPENITQKLIREIRERKGLTPETPKPQAFVSIR
jgi:elongation factor 2